MTVVESGRTLIAPPRNMVQEVRNIIEGYSMGAIRALAQEPVQNALDAKKPGAKIVRVEYRVVRRALGDGSEIELLTVTDSGTTGLRGPVLAPDDLFARETTGPLGKRWAIPRSARTRSARADKERRRSSTTRATTPA